MINLHIYATESADKRLILLIPNHRSGVRVLFFTRIAMTLDATA